VKTASLTVAIICAAGTLATSAYAIGTADERAACTPDVFRLCSSEIPNVSAIIACLKKEKAKLSPGCRAAFNPPAGKTAAATRSVNSSAASEWCDFRGNARHPGQQDWLKWCGKAARK
jgi:hypothetical protein